MTFQEDKKVVYACTSESEDMPWLDNLPSSLKATWGMSTRCCNYICIHLGSREKVERSKKKDADNRLSYSCSACLPYGESFCNPARAAPANRATEFLKAQLILPKGTELGFRRYYSFPLSEDKLILI